MRANFKNIKEKLIEDLLFIAAISSIVVVLFIFIFLMKEGAFAFLENGVFNFIFGTKWRIETGTYGMAPLIIGSLLVTVGAVGFAIIFGIPSAIFLSELAPPRMGNILKPTVELLNDIPSIVYGFIGVVLLLTSLRDTFDMIDGHSFLAGSILLGVMALPTIITISDDQEGCSSSCPSWNLDGCDPRGWQGSGRDRSNHVTAVVFTGRGIPHSIFEQDE
jgi:ABC-type phosphate transport system permease subunit